MPSNSKLTTINLPLGSTLQAPANWSIETKNQYTQTIAPEGDLTISLITMPLVGSIDDTTQAAWKQIDPNFADTIQFNINVPPTGNWDQFAQIVYDVPSSSQRVVMAIVRTFQHTAYLCLATGSTAGFSRRSGDLMQIVESWKPQGFIE